MNISSFDDLLHAARAQPEPQRLLFVFADADLPEDATPAQRAGFQAGQGGALIPTMSVDKAPEELDTFAALVEESRRFGENWSIVFVAGLSGRGGRAPTSDEADQSLQRMVEAVKTGAFGAFMPFDRQGNPMLID
ncbi:MAG: ribonucleotide reductase subunit alpha [Burkholderiales bacterium]|nr:ribonucleotide reductase subunit alpha [Burkholderiales bacterium]